MPQAPNSGTDPRDHCFTFSLSTLLSSPQFSIIWFLDNFVWFLHVDKTDGWYANHNDVRIAPMFPCMTSRFHPTRVSASALVSVSLFFLCFFSFRVFLSLDHKVSVFDMQCELGIGFERINPGLELVSPTA